MNPRYPIYVISKGRWESRLTVRALDRCRVNYRVVIEPQELESYASVIDRSRLLVLPFSNLGQGSIPARNFVWEHSIQEGYSRHWILDDNILGFHRLNHNLKLPVSCGSTFAAIEDFADRYENVAQAGMQYFMFAPARAVHAPLILNTRIYSCMLNLNSIKHRWRGRYNEDTDLSIRCLKDGWATVLFQTLLADKMTTMTMKGGNTDELYQADGRLKMAQSLVDQHPDICRITWKFNRWQHQVDYSSFGKNELKLRPGVVVKNGVNNYGMVLEIDGERLTGDEQADHKRVNEKLREEATAEKNDFAAQAAKYAAKGKITSSQWTKLLNAGCYAGLTIEKIDAKIREKYGTKTRELPSPKFDEALEFLRRYEPTGQEIVEKAFNEVSNETLKEIDAKLGTSVARDDEDNQSVNAPGAHSVRNNVSLSLPETKNAAVSLPGSVVDSSTNALSGEKVVESPAKTSPAAVETQENPEDELITSKQWTKLLNAGLSSGKSFDAITELVKARFECRIRDLKVSQYDEAMELVK